MAKKRTSKKQRNFSIFDVPIVKPKPNVKRTVHYPEQRLRDIHFIAQALAEAIVVGDKSGFLEILGAHIKAKNISEIERTTKIKRSTIYAAIAKDANPTLDTIISLVQKTA